MYWPVLDSLVGANRPDEMLDTFLHRETRMAPLEDALREFCENQLYIKQALPPRTI